MTSPSTHPAHLDALYRHRPLRNQRVRITLMTLLLAILQPATFVIFQHTVLATKVSLAEGAVPNDALSAVFAVFESAFYLLGGHAAKDREGHMEGGGGRDQG